ncbi:MAG: helix-turn-helix transcriptional regulator [Caulobacteraceae bacterium]|nr:helix-turn-helix transcriptional regulator [Caulobacteraceae bacterium]
MSLRSPAPSLSEFETCAAEAAEFLKLLANENRLLVLCWLAETKEASVNALAQKVGLSQSALSQHLARLKDDGLVSFRREAQTLYYQVSDPRVLRALALLKDLFRPDFPKTRRS